MWKKTLRRFQSLGSRHTEFSTTMDSLYQMTTDTSQVGHYIWTHSSSWFPGHWLTKRPVTRFSLFYIYKRYVLYMETKILIVLFQCMFRLGSSGERQQAVLLALVCCGLWCWCSAGSEAQCWEWRPARDHHGTTGWSPGANPGAYWNQRQWEPIW